MGLFRKSRTYWVDIAGRRVKASAPGAKKRKVQSKMWTGRYRDENGLLIEVPLCRSKSAAETMLNDLKRKVELGKAGLRSPFEEQHARPLSEHLADFKAHLRAKGNTAEHCEQAYRRAQRIISGCRFLFINDITPGPVEAMLARMRADGTSQQTSNFYLQSMKQFCRWLVADRRTGDNRVAHMAAGNVAADRRLERRELSQDEISYLLRAAYQGPLRSGLSGESRRMLYATAIGTGLRASELASLTPREFCLTAEVSTARILAKNEKAGRGNVLPLPADLAALLRLWLAGKPSDVPLWPGKWAEYKQASKLIRADLKRARLAWLAEVEEGAPERKKREESEFLEYRTTAGQADFHSLRHTFLSRLGRSGAHPRVMMELARHTTVELTLNRYTHVSMADLASAVGKLPSLPMQPDADEGHLG